MRKIFLGLLASVSLAASAHAASFAVVTVQGTDMPWVWVDGGQNDAFKFGDQDGTGPATFNFSSLGIGAGGSYGLLWVGGLTSAFGGPPTVDNGGYAGSVFKNDDPGSSGNYFPSLYLGGDYGTLPDSGVFLNALVGAFTDGSGNVLNPFSLGTYYDDGSKLIGISGNLGSGVTAVQFGMNDDIFSDNTGSLSVCVDAGDGTCFAHFYGGSNPVPEPTTWALMIVGLGSLGMAMRRRRAMHATA